MSSPADSPARAALGVGGDLYRTQSQSEEFIDA